MKYQIKNILRFLLLMSIVISCNTDSTNDMFPIGDDVFRLKWNKAYPDDTMTDSKIGLEWAYSYLGAALPQGSPGIDINGDYILISIDHLGFNESAQEKLEQLHAGIRASEEYQLNDAVDLGRYVTLLLGSAEHYYAIAGVPDTLEDLLANYILKPEMGYVNNSGVSHEHRKIRFSEQENLKQVFISEETDSVTGEIYEYETVEILPNGQLRFGIFDVDGTRKTSADASHSNAGKPAKCMWCHESNINQLFAPQNDYPGFITYPQLQNTLITYNQMLDTQKALLVDGVDFSETQQHTLAELLYISFMEPSAERLSLEWNMPVAQVQDLLSGLETHVYDEFPFLGNLYHRADVEGFAPFSGLEVSSDVREPSAVEVNHIQ